MISGRVYVRVYAPATGRPSQDPALMAQWHANCFRPANPHVVSGFWVRMGRAP